MCYGYAGAAGSESQITGLALTKAITPEVRESPPIVIYI
jgi:hypothetical protein